MSDFDICSGHGFLKLTVVSTEGSVKHTEITHFLGRELNLCLEYPWFACMVPFFP